MCFGVLASLCVGSKGLSFFNAGNLFLLAFLIVCGLLAPLRQGWIDGLEQLDFSFVNLGFGLSAGLVVILLQQKTVFALNLMTLLFTFWYGVNGCFNFKHTVEQVSDPFYELSSRKNVFVIGFDSLESHTVESLFQAEPKLRKKYAGFTLYKNTVGHAVDTELSILGVQSGFLKSGLSTAEHRSKYKDNQITNRLAANQIQVRALKQFATNSNSNVLTAQTLWKNKTDLEY